ncbi:hypothetical protein ACFL14_00920 [Patescibacteria group bacterium]
MNTKTKWIIGISITLGLIFISLIVYFIFFGKICCIPEDNQKDNQTTGMPKCESDKELFTQSPIAFEDLFIIIPLGNLGPPAHTFPTDHMYFRVNYEEEGNFESPTILAPVYAPGDIWITTIKSMEKSGGGEETETDHVLRFSPCQEFKGYFNHVVSLSPKLEKEFEKNKEGSCDEYQTGGFTYKSCTASVQIKVEAEEEIGTAGGPGYQSALDFGAIDERINPNEFANADRWYEGKTQIVCPLDYYSKNMKEKLEALLGGHDGSTKRTIEPVCGTNAQDKVGTAQGIWFVKDTKEVGSEDLHMALVHDNINPSRAAFSIGNSIKGLEGELAYYIPVDSGLINRDFGDVKSDGNVYCYEPWDRFNMNNPLPFTIILELTADDKLRIEKRNQTTCGNGPWQFSSSYADFER